MKSKHKVNDNTFDLGDRTSIPRLEAKTSITYIPDPMYAHVEKKLFIAPVALLGKTNKYAFGVYAKQKLPYENNSPYCKEARIGQYMGETINCSSVNDRSYLFQLKDLKNGIDAKYRRNWTAYVNSTSCYAKANVMAILGEHEVYYHQTRTIEKDEQLYLYYSDDYHDQDATDFQVMKFFNKTDNWLDSDEIFEKHRFFYDPKPQPLRSDIQTFFGINSCLFILPAFTMQQGRGFTKKCYDEGISKRVDHPIMACDNQSGRLLPQEQQENITLLMVAVWEGMIDVARFLLSKGADPNIQSNIRGYTVLHLIAASPKLKIEQQKELIVLLLHYHVYLQLQDDQNKSVFHWMIERGQIELALFLISKMGKITILDSEDWVLNCIDKKKHDPFLCSIYHGATALVLCLMNYTSALDLQYYFDEKPVLGCKDNPFMEALKSYRVHTNSQCFRQLLMALNSVIETDSEIDNVVRKKIRVVFKSIGKELNVNIPSGSFPVISTYPGCLLNSSLIKRKQAENDNAADSNVNRCIRRARTGSFDN